MSSSSDEQVAGELGTPRYEAANTLLDDRYFDNLSGQQAYRCFACRAVKGGGEWDRFSYRPDSHRVEAVYLL